MDRAGLGPRPEKNHPEMARPEFWTSSLDRPETGSRNGTIEDGPPETEDFWAWPEV